MWSSLPMKGVPAPPRALQNNVPIELAEYSRANQPASTVDHELFEGQFVLCAEPTVFLKRPQKRGRTWRLSETKAEAREVDSFVCQGEHHIIGLHSRCRVLFAQTATPDLLV